MYLNLTFMNLYFRTGILIRYVNYLPSINSARYTQRIIQTVKFTGGGKNFTVEKNYRDTGLYLTPCRVTFYTGMDIRVCTPASRSLIVRPGGWALSNSRRT